MAQTNQASGMFCDSKMPPAPTPPDGLAGAEALSTIYNLIKFTKMADPRDGGGPCDDPPLPPTHFHDKAIVCHEFMTWPDTILTIYIYIY